MKTMNIFQALVKQLLQDFATVIRSLFTLTKS